MSQGLVEVDPGLVEGLLVDFELGVGCLHVNSLVFVGSSSHQCDELFLPGSLLRHVGVGEEVLGDVIRKHELIEFVNDSADGCFSSESVVK